MKKDVSPKRPNYGKCLELLYLRYDKLKTKLRHSYDFFPASSSVFGAIKVGDMWRFTLLSNFRLQIVPENGIQNVSV